ncbi:stationary phase growth adaptation protein [Caballeronia choica]|jgi:hypothetical protein|uniref:Stationary phase growth adaptation protein n=2 Tax=Caballeronia choica TaxID=326476 RepID=A0A158FHP6_9BURK|nr:stationary phase growth adaptation protein [Caballeronia choica]
MQQLDILVVEISPEPAHRFPAVLYRGVTWDLSHLDSFAFKMDLGMGSDVTVLVLFSCHCFSHSFRWDERPRHEIPVAEIYDDGREQRVLSATRYELSRRYLRDIVVSLRTRRIAVADEKQPNFVTCESVNSDGTISVYAVFFGVEKDKKRKRRLVLRVQSAYVLRDGLSRRQTKARKVAFDTLLRATYLGKVIRG